MRVQTTNPDLAHFATKMARTTSDIIINAIMPPRVISIQGDLLIINQGGDAIVKGRKYKLVQLGKRLVDPYTKESLGQEEQDAGIIEIVDSTDRTSKARIIKKILITSVSVVLENNFIIRPISEINSHGMKKKINIDKEEKSVNRRIDKLKTKSKDDW